MTLYDQFIKDVKDNPHKHNEFVHLAVDRHLNDLKKSKSKNYPYYFNEDEADRVISIIKLLRHTKGSFAKKLFDLQPYQGFIVAMLFGWLNKETKSRKHQKAYLETARKSGKSEFAAAIKIVMFLFDEEEGAECYTVATKKEQAEYVYSAAKKMLKMLIVDMPELKERIRLLQYKILDDVTGSLITKLTSDGDKEEGASPHIGVVDEWHAHKDNGITKAVETGMVERGNPLLLIITTAGYNKQGPCYQFRQNVVLTTLRGQIDNDRLFCIIFTLDEDDDWNDESTWNKSNPNLGKTPNLESFRGLYEMAVNEGSGARVSFLTKNLNIWTDSAKTWIKSEDWNDCAKKIAIEDFKGMPCVIGVDLSTSQDISALCVLFPPFGKRKKFATLFYFFCPASKIDGVKRADQVDYREWRDKGHIIVTPNPKTIDYGYIKNTIDEIATLCDVQMLCYDPWNSDKIIPELEMQGMNCVMFKQTCAWMHAPVKKIELIILEQKMIHDGNPVMGWMMGNVDIFTDSNDNKKIDKKKSISKVDGPVAMANAVGGYLMNEDNELTADDLGYIG